VLELAVADARRLVEAAPGLHQLHRDVVIVPFAVRRLARARADDVRHHFPLGRALDAEIFTAKRAVMARSF
jgi:hypothetical protein